VMMVMVMVMRQKSEALILLFGYAVLASFLMLCRFWTDATGIGPLPSVPSRCNRIPVPQKRKERGSLFLS
jgi:hypothetical protein